MEGLLSAGIFRTIGGAEPEAIPDERKTKTERGTQLHRAQVSRELGARPEQPPRAPLRFRRKRPMRCGVQTTQRQPRARTQLEHGATDADGTELGARRIESKVYLGFALNKPVLHLMSHSQ